MHPTIVLLDIGGVLVELGGLTALRRMLGEHLSDEDLHALWAASEAVLQYETGRSDAQTFAAHVVNELKIDLEPHDFLKDFEQWPIRLQPGAMELLRAIPATYRPSALSNTNDIHRARAADVLGLDGVFHRRYFSHELGFMKPNPRIYEAVLDDLKVDARNLLFIDDSQTNVEAARAIGMQAHLAVDARHARAVLEDCGVIPLAR